MQMIPRLEGFYSMDNRIRSISTPKQRFTESQSQKKKADKGQSIPFALPETPNTSSVDPAEAAQRLSILRREILENLLRYPPKVSTNTGYGRRTFPPKDGEPAQQADEAVDLSETTPIPMNLIEIINTLHLPKARAVSRSTRR